MFLGWYDPDRKKPARQKLADAIACYEDKFGQVAALCLTNPQDAFELSEPTRNYPDELPVLVQARGYIARFTFYVGQDADAGPAERGATT